MKKQVSPVVTVVVILVVVVIVVLLWMRFSTPAREPGAAGGGMSLNLDPSKLTPEQLEKARIEAQAADKQVEELRKGSARQSGTGSE